MIKCLPEEVQTSLRSGVAINSVGHCVEELILNSVDAKATCIAIRVDLETFKVQVVDNGCGMGREDLNNVGNRYFTSKCYSLEDLENLKFYGFRGEALASIASMASILEISSRTSRTAKTFLKLFHNGKGLEVSEAELNRPSLGTTVTVYNLYHQLPVRRKCMDLTLEFERLRHKVEALSLVHPSVSLSLRNEASCSMVLQLPKTKDMCTRFSQIYGLGKSQKLREINYRSGGFEIMGFISSEGHYNKNIQFLYVNNRLILKTKLHKLIAFLLRKQSVIGKTKTGSLLSSPVCHRSGSELHGVFIINVKCQHDEYDICLEPAKTLIEFRRWNALLTCLEEGVKAFLKQEHLFIELCGEDTTDTNENNDFCLGNPTTLQSSLPKEKNIQESFKSACDNIAESYETFNLQSKSVRRKATLTKKIPDNIQPINNVKEVSVYSDVTRLESVNELRSSKDKYLLPNKNNIISDCLQFNKFPEESELHINVMSSKCPEELGIQDKISETDQYSDSLLCTENNGKKDANSQQDAGIQERNPDLDNVGCAETEKNIDECKSKYIFGHSMMGKCKLEKKGRKSFTELNIARGLMIEQDPLKLGSKNITTYLPQNQPSYKTIESSNLLNRQAKLGPVSAKDIFENQLEFSEQIPSSLENMTKTNIIHIGNTKEWLKKKSTSASLPADSTVHSVISHVKGYMPVVPADSVIHLGDINSRRQINDSAKLSCHSKLGSLDRFRKYYGNLKRNASIKDTEIRNSDETPVCSGSMAGDRTDIQNICETPTKECIKSNNNNNGCNSLLPLEKSQRSPEENLSSRKGFSSNAITEYSQKVRHSLSGSNCTRTLASKVSRMKECDKDVISTQPIEKASAQTEVCSDPKDKNIQHFTSRSIHLQSTYKKPQHCLSIREEEEESNCFASASDKQGNSMDAGADVEGTVRHCFIDTDGEYTISQNRHLVLCNKVDIDSSCGDASIMGEFTKQAVKCNELQSVNLPGNMEKNTDDSSVNEKPKFYPSEWFYKFDASLGRMVFINKMSGLSSYRAPAEETSVACTQDLSTIAVNVIEKDAQEESLQGLLSEWDNPVFPQCPDVALDVSSGQADTLAVKIHNILYPYRFTKKMIDSLQVLNQVDNKFIACLINTREDENEHADGNLLVLVDQHAAHERVRLEQLITDSYDKQHEALGKKKLLASTLCPPLEIEVTEDQRRLLWCCHKNLENLGLELLFPKNNLSQILVGKVPLCFVEKEANELRRGRHTVTKRIVQELIQEQIELLQTTGGAQATLPLTILKVLASQACHGAIKFNNSLTFDESCHLMASLSCCQLPFQCAHGRPSMLPLADVDHLQQESQPKPNLAKLRKMVKAWKLFGKEKESTVNLEASTVL